MGTATAHNHPSGSDAAWPSWWRVWMLHRRVPSKWFWTIFKGVHFNLCWFIRKLISVHAFDICLWAWCAQSACLWRLDDLTKNKKQHPWINEARIVCMLSVFATFGLVGPIRVPADPWNFRACILCIRQCLWIFVCTLAKWISMPNCDVPGNYNCWTGALSPCC